MTNITSCQPFWIQTATPKQVSAIAQVVNESFRVDGRDFYRIPNTNRIEIGNLKDMIGDRAKFRVYACLRNDPQGNPEIIGATYLDIKSSEIYMFAVAVGREKQGIGTAILEHVEKCARHQFALGKMHLGIINDTRQLYLKRFYEKRGYQCVGIGSTTNPKRFHYIGGEKIKEDGRERKPDTISVLLYKKQL